jgi:hypothetical protein
VSEGDPEDWAAVATAISGRVRELGWRQRELGRKRPRNRRRGGRADVTAETPVTTALTAE